MKKVIAIPLSSAKTYGPHIEAELLAGKVVSVAGFLLRLRAEDVAPPEFSLI